MPTIEDVEFKKYLPQGFTDHPTTVRDALVQGKAVLAEEDHWVKGQLYEIDHPEEDPDNPFCDSWRVCAMGAVALVTIGAYRSTYKDTDPEPGFESEDQWKDAWDVNDARHTAPDTQSFQLYTSALRVLDSALPTYTLPSSTGYNPNTGGYEQMPEREEQFETTWEFNDADGTTYEQVLELFDRAIAKADAEEE